MPEVLRSATITIQELALPIGSPVVVIGRDTEGQIVCQLTIKATGIEVYGPKGGFINNLNWEQLVGLLRPGE